MFGKANNLNPTDRLQDLDINPVDFFNQGLITPDAALEILAACGSVPGGCTCGKAGCACFYGSGG